MNAAVAGPTAGLLGRRREQEVLDQLIVNVRRGESAALVIRGEAGIGKTALLQFCAHRSAGTVVAQITAIQSELELPFAALHQLCAPMLGLLPVLPEPQKQALEVAFGLSTSPTPDRFMVGLAVLGLLAECARKAPLVCLIDDAQWLDESSSQVFGFVGRRLVAESVLFILALREDATHRLFSDLPEMRLDGLADEDARRLLSQNVPVQLDTEVRDRIIAETRGNPRGLLELPRRLTHAELTGGYGIPSTANISTQIREQFIQRVQALPVATQQLMLLAAADTTGDPRLLSRAARRFGIKADAVAVAEEEQLLEVATQVRFRHPLVRSAAYAAASPADRSAAHHALAEATDPEVRPERRVWHLAAATRGENESVASEVVRAAGMAQARAGLAASAAFLERAVSLTPDPGLRADRALTAAQAHLHAGEFQAARGMLMEAAALASDDLQRARVEQLSSQNEAAAQPGRESPLRLLQAARRLESLDVALARDTYLQAWGAAALAGRLAAPGADLRRVSEAARAAPRLAHPRPSDVLLDGLSTAILDGRRAAAPMLRQAISLCLSEQGSPVAWLQWGRGATIAAFALWDAECWAELSSRQVEHARASGALAPLVLALNFHAFMNTNRGDLEAATSLVTELNTVKEVTGIRMASPGAALLAAYQGRPPDATGGERAETGDGYAMEITSLGHAVLNNGLGQYSAALEAAEETAYGISLLAPLAVSELIEAAVRCGRRDVAVGAVHRLASVTVRGSDWAAGMEARARALVSSGETAQTKYKEAIGCLHRTPLRPEVARSHLLFGEWLRRENRRLEAREHLRTAHEMFTSMGATAFTERARLELLATGERVRRRDTGEQNDLTAQEEHIARLARDGYTNAEIGAKLFLSARTVEWHLGKAFLKLNISSRRQLRDSLPSTGP